jgi:hypothetical protein
MERTTTIASRWLLGLVLTSQIVCGTLKDSAAETPAGFRVDVLTPVDAPEGRYWMQVRAGAIPSGELGRPARHPLVVIAMQLHDSSGTHMYHGISSMRSADMSNMAMSCSWTSAAGSASRLSLGSAIPTI